MRQNNKFDKNEFLGKYWLVFVTIGVAVVFGICEPSFFQPTNMLNILSLSCLTGLAGIGVTCIMAVGETDFSTGVQVTMGAMLMAVILDKQWITNYYVVFVLTLVIMALYGMFNAFLHIKVGIPSFIATLASSNLMQGLVKWAMGNNTLYNSSRWPEEYNILGQGYLFGVIPNTVIILVIVAAIMLIYTERTVSGKYIYAVGVNSEACKYMGINQNKQKLKGFVICSVLCGLTGIVQGSMINGASPTLGDPMLLNSLAVLMLGAIMRKGVFNVPGTIVGAILMAIITNGLTMLGADSATKDMVQGGVLLLAVTVVAVIRIRSGHVKLPQRKKAAEEQVA